MRELTIRIIGSGGLSLVTDTELNKLNRQEQTKGNIMLHGTGNLILAIWFGALLTTGYIMEPVLIVNTDRITANNIASTMFDTVTVVGMACAIIYLLLQLLSRHLKHWHSYLGVVLFLFMLINYTVLLPEISELMNMEKPDGSAERGRYDLMHTLSISSYLLTMAGVGLLVYLRKQGSNT